VSRALGTAAASIAGAALVVAFLVWRLAAGGTERECLAAIARAGGRAEYRSDAGRLEVEISPPSAGDEALDAIAALPRLESLTLRGAAVSDASLSRLSALGGRRDLHSLTLERTSVAGPGLAALGSLPIRSLVLARNPIPPDALAGLRSLRGLRHVTLDDDGLGDAGLAHLEGCDQLDSLTLFAPRVTESGSARLAAALPRCEVRRHGR
jgi:hypothetical protein